MSNHSWPRHGPANFDRNKVQDGSAGVIVTLDAGECTTVTETIVLNQVSLDSIENVKFFAWAQNTIKVWQPVMYYQGDPFSAHTAEIYQGAKALHPFEGVFIDDFESTDTTAWSTATH